MIKAKNKIRWSALFLAMLVFCAFGAKTLHHFACHAEKEHHETSCSDECSKINTHFHTTEAHTDDCGLCDFTFAKSLIFPVVFHLKNIQADFPKAVFTYINTPPSVSYTFSASRAPPVL